MKFEKTILQSGLTVISRLMPTNGFTYAMMGTRRGGSFFGPPQLFHFLEHLIGLPFRQKRVIDHEEDASTSISRVIITEFSTPTQKFKKKLQEKILNFARPAFYAYKTERGALAVELGIRHDNPAVFLEKLFLMTCFPKSNIARPFSKEFENIRHTITPSILRFYWKKFFAPSNLILCVINEKECHEEICGLMDAHFVPVKAPKPRLRRPRLGLPTASISAPVVVIRPELCNVYFTMGRPLPILSLKTTAALEIGGGFFEHLINHKLRYQNGLIYTLSLDYWCPDYLFSYWGLNGECEPKNFQRMMEVILRELRLFSVSERALKRCKNVLLEKRKRIITEPSSCANALYDQEVDGIDFEAYSDAIASLTPSVVQHAFTKWFSPQKVVLTVLTANPDIITAP